MNPRQELELLENLMDRLLGSIEGVLSSGEELSDELQGLLAQELRETFSRTEQLRAQIAQEDQERQQQEQTQADSVRGLPPASAPSPDAQLLWILSGQQPQAFISYLRSFPTQNTQQLLNNPILLSSTIDHLNHLMPPGQLPVIDGIQHADLNSSNVWGASYDPISGRMRVRFQGGSEYEYDGIPRNIFNAFIKGNANARTTGRNRYGRWWVDKNPSLGAALNQYIKAGGFPYRRLR